MQICIDWHYFNNLSAPHTPYKLFLHLNSILPVKVSLPHFLLQHRAFHIGKRHLNTVHSLLTALQTPLVKVQENCIDEKVVVIVIKQYLLVDSMGLKERLVKVTKKLVKLYIPE